MEADKNDIQLNTHEVIFYVLVVLIHRNVFDVLAEGAVEIPFRYRDTITLTALY